MILRVGHLYPEYLNIYADRGNIAVLTRRAAARGHELSVAPVTLGTALEAASYDLLYVGGGQDREQAMIAPDLAARGETIRAAVEDGPGSSQCAAATSSSGVGTAAATAPGSKAQVSSRTRRSRARGA